METVIASAVFLMGTAMVLSATYALQYATRQEKIQNEIERDAARILDYMQRDINRAAAISSGWNGFQTSSITLVLDIPIFDENEIIIPNTLGRIVYAYDTQQNHLERFEFAPESDDNNSSFDFMRIPNVVSFELFYENLNFSSYQLKGKPLSEASNVEVYLALRIWRDGRVYELDYSSSATIRNKL